MYTCYSEHVWRIGTEGASYSKPGKTALCDSDFKFGSLYNFDWYIIRILLHKFGAIYIYIYINGISLNPKYTTTSLIVLSKRNLRENSSLELS